MTFVQSLLLAILIAVVLAGLGAKTEMHAMAELRPAIHVSHPKAACALAEKRHFDAPLVPRRGSPGSSPGMTIGLYTDASA